MLALLYAFQYQQCDILAADGQPLRACMLPDQFQLHCSQSGELKVVSTFTDQVYQMLTHVVSIYVLSINIKSLQTKYTFQLIPCHA